MTTHNRCGMSGDRAPLAMALVTSALMNVEQVPTPGPAGLSESSVPGEVSYAVRVHVRVSNQAQFERLQRAAAQSEPLALVPLGHEEWRP